MHIYNARPYVSLISVLCRGDHVDSFTCYIGTELRRIPDEETVGALKLQILKLIFDAQATTTNYNAHPPQ